MARNGGTHVCASTLVLWRCAFGACFVAHLVSIIRQDMLGAFFAWSSWNFKYAGATWVGAPGVPALWCVVVATALAAAWAACVGRSSGSRRAACALAFLGYAYVFALEKAWYVNHHYLMLLCWLLWALTEHADLRPLWTLPPQQRCSPHLLTAWRVLFVVVYTWAGVAKLNWDWLARAQPIRMWFFEGSLFFPQPFFANIVPLQWTGFASFFIAYSGIAVDLVGGPALLWRRTRPFALAAQVAFHCINMVTFDIGVFPILMLASSVLWLPPTWIQCVHQRVCDRFASRVRRRPMKPASGSQSPQHVPSRMGAWQLRLLVAFFAVLVCSPASPHLHGAMSPAGTVSWTQEGSRFSWMMMLHQHDTFVRWLAVVSGDANAATQRLSIPSSHPDVRLTDYQRAQMKRHPRMLCEFAHNFVIPWTRHVHGDHVSVEVSIDVWKSVNGRPFQRWIDPDHVFSHTNCHWSDASQWIQPQIPEFHTLQWLSYQDTVKADWQGKGYEVVFFADEPDEYVEFHVKPFCDEFLIVVLHGDVALFTDHSDDPIELQRDQPRQLNQTQTFHGILSGSYEATAWMYAMKGRYGSMTAAFGMD